MVAKKIAVIGAGNMGTALWGISVRMENEKKT
jgi:glycerol-3-phosphate dehydrogenase